MRELLRYSKKQRVRRYHLSVVDDRRAELWVVAEGKGAARTRKLTDLNGDDDLGMVLDDLERQLRSGGWVKR